jgi:hypothetical protein
MREIPADKGPSRVKPVILALLIGAAGLDVYELPMLGIRINRGT